MNYDEIAAKVVEIIQRDYYLVKKKSDFSSGDKTAIATKILGLVCSHFDVVHEQVANMNCKSDYVKVRFIFYYLVDKYYPMISNGEMGALTGRAVNTVLYGIRSIKKDLKKDADLQNLVNDIEHAFLLERNTDKFYKQLNNGKDNETRQEGSGQKNHRETGDFRIYFPGVPDIQSSKFPQSGDPKEQ